MKRKIELLINGMFYGDSYTKRMLWSIVLVPVFAIGALLTGIALTSFIAYGAAAVLLIIEIFLLKSIDIGVGVTGGDVYYPDEEIDIDQYPSHVQEPLKKVQPHEQTDGLEDALASISAALEEQENGSTPSTKSSEQRMENRTETRSETKDRQPEHREPIRESRMDQEVETTYEEAEEDFSSAFPSLDDAFALEDEALESEREEPKRVRVEAQGEEPEEKVEEPPKKVGLFSKFFGKKKNEKEPPKKLEDYTQKDIKKTFYKYKVKKNHRPVLIDHCDKSKVKECPAYAWSHRGTFHLLLMLGTPKEITMGLGEASHMYYEKEYPANQKEEYDCLVGNGLIPLVFGEYRPIYTPVIRNNRQEEVKNLYRIGEYYFTAASARELMSLLTPDFIVEDSVTESEEYNQYFKQVYKLKILLDDGVIHIKDYQYKVKNILQKLAEAPITPAAFRMTLTDMAQRRLITPEYVNFYTQYNKTYRERHSKN